AFRPESAVDVLRFVGDDERLLIQFLDGRDEFAFIFPRGEDLHSSPFTVPAVLIAVCDAVPPVSDVRRQVAVFLPCNHIDDEIAERQPLFDLESDKDTRPETERICHNILELVQVLKHKPQSDDVDKCLHDAESCCCITVPFECCNGAHRQKAHIYDIDDEYDKHHQPGIRGNGCYHAKFPL